MRLKPWIRNFLTRCLAIVPSLVVSLIGGSGGAGNLIIIASVKYLYLSFLYSYRTLAGMKLDNLNLTSGLTVGVFHLRELGLCILYPQNVKRSFESSTIYAELFVYM